MAAKGRAAALGGWINDGWRYAILPLLCLWIIAWYGFLEPPFLRYTNLPFDPLDEEVEAGHPIRFKVVRCSIAKEPRLYQVVSNLHAMTPGLDDVLLPADRPVSIRPGCHVSVSTVNVVPICTAPGIYTLNGHAEVKGTVRTILVAWETLPFRVKPSTAKGGPTCDA